MGEQNILLAVGFHHAGTERGHHGVEVDGADLVLGHEGGGVAT